MEGVGGAGESSSNLYYGNIVNDGGGMYASDDDIVANNTITDCTQGVNIETFSNDIIVGNTITNNSGPALATVGYVEGGLTNCGLNNTFYANYVANNAIGILVDTFNQWHSGNFTVYDNDFKNNNQQAQVIISTSSTYWNYNLQGGPWSDYWNSSEVGNYWSDYLASYPNASQIASTGIWNTPYYVGGGEQDNYPLVNPFDISSVNLQLPTWANITVPSPLSTPSFPTQSILVSSTPTAKPTDSATATPSQSSSPTPTVSEFPTWIILPLFAVATLLSILFIRQRITKK
jgi:nitrous oxidase accessory protein NosD